VPISSRPEQFVRRRFTRAGDTPMGAASSALSTSVTQRKRTYRENGIMFYRPWIFMITDGGPTDQWKSAAEQVKQEKPRRRRNFRRRRRRCQLRRYSARSRSRTVKLDGLRFRDLFQWLSNSQQVCLTIDAGRRGTA